MTHPAIHCFMSRCNVIRLIKPIIPCRKCAGYDSNTVCEIGRPKHNSNKQKRWCRQKVTSKRLPEDGFGRCVIHIVGKWWAANHVLAATETSEFVRLIKSLWSMDNDRWIIANCHPFVINRKITCAKAVQHRRIKYELKLTCKHDYADY